MPFRNGQGAPSDDWISPSSRTTFRRASGCIVSMSMMSAQPFASVMSAPISALLSGGSAGRGAAPIHQDGSHRSKDEDDAADQQLVDNHELLDG
jgi:hypothetical protein